MTTGLAIPQLYDRTQALLREAGMTVAKLTMGRFDVPLTPEQREAMDRFVSTARDRELPMVHVQDERFEIAHVLIISPKVSA